MVACLRSTKLVELLRAADPGGKMYVSVANAGLALGADPSQPTILIDISNETAVAMNGATMAAAPQQNVGLQIPTTDFNPGRTSGKYWIEIKGRRITCKSVKDVLLIGLREIEALSEGTLAKLTNIKKRTRRIVATDRDELFETKHLVQKHSEPLQGGWWVGTNNSSPEVERWLQLATECAGIKWGRDVKTSL